MILLSERKETADKLFSVEGRKVFSAFTNPEKPWAAYCACEEEFLLVQHVPGAVDKISGTLLGGASAAHIFGIISAFEAGEKFTVVTCAMQHDGAARTYLIGDKTDVSKENVLVVIALPHKGGVRLLVLVEDDNKKNCFSVPMDFERKVSKALRAFLEILGFAKKVDAGALMLDLDKGGAGLD